MKIDGLTMRQHEVAQLIANGLTDKQIAGRLEPPVSDETVAFHVQRIATAWNLNRSHNLRVQIANRFPRTAA